MASEIKLPQLGENLSGGDVVDIKVSAGDTVARGQTLLEVEAEKSTVEGPSPVAGRIAEMRVKKGEPVTVGQTLCVVEESEPVRAGPKTPAAKSTQPSTEEIKREAHAAKPVPPLRQPTERVRDTAETVAASALARQAREPGRPQQAAPAPPAQEQNAAPTGNGRREQQATTPGEPGARSRKLVPAGPATRRLARELGVDLARVAGTAPGGRVTPEDVKAYVRELTAGGMAAMNGLEAPPLPDFARWGPVERRPLDGVRRKTAEQMALAWSLIPHVTQHDEADITELEAFRKTQTDTGPKLTVTAFALKAAAVALRQFPQFNSSLDLAGGQLIVKQYIHIGVAVDTERGLLVPVIRDVGHKSIHLLAEELGAIAEKARQKKIAVEEMRGGCFTITNLGGIGGTGFTPIVNYPEVAILGISRARWQPLVRDGSVVPRLLLPLSLSYDHRVIDGADAARFTRRIAEMFENPLLMLLDA